MEQPDVIPALVQAPAQPPARTRVAFDPGWLFLLAGLALLVSTALIPAVDDLGRARWLRDRALVIEQHRVNRVTRHEEYLEALKSKDQGLLLTLAATQLNQIPTDRDPLAEVTDSKGAGASVFPALEPDALPLPTEHKVHSLLHHFATGERTRLWMIGIGAVMVLIGLLPQSKATIVAGIDARDPQD
ncbi:MAG: hypothetical protein AABZ53_07870 [Planctomycetota bacterium]